MTDKPKPEATQADKIAVIVVLVVIVIAILAGIIWLFTRDSSSCPDLQQICSL